MLLVADDVAMLIDAARDGYDAILLDVDNGPEGITRRINEATGIEPRDIDVIITEQPRHNWGLMGEPGDEIQLTYKVAV